MNEVGERGTPWGVLLLCLGLSVVSVMPFYFLGESEPGDSFWSLRMPDTHDLGLHLDQMKSFYAGLSAGEFYPRWEEDTNQGYGAPTTSFYPPGIYYLTSALYVFLRNWIWVILAVQLLIRVASACAIYIYARRLMSRPAACVAMSAYVFFPYYFLDQYQRGAIAELLAFVWMPLVLLFTERLFREGKGTAWNRDGEIEETIIGTPSQGSTGRANNVLFNVIGLTLSYGAFLWTHPPTAFQFTLALGLFVLVLTIYHQDWRGAVGVAGAMILALGLSAAYLYPAAVEQNLIRHEIIEQDWPYHETHVFARAEYTKDNPDFFKRIDEIWIFGTAAMGAGAIALFSLKTRGQGVSRWFREHIVLWTVLGGFTCFMMTRASAPLGRRIPEIEVGVFSWRMLTITTLVVALLAGAAIEAALDARREKHKLKLTIFFALAVLMTLGSAAFSIRTVVAPMWGAVRFEPESQHLNDVIIPSTAPANIEDLPPLDRATVAHGNGRVSIEQWKPEHRVLRVTLSKSDEVRIRTFNYRGWVASVDGRPAVIATDKKLGIIVLELPVGAHHVELDYNDTPPRGLGRKISWGAFLLMAVVTAAAFLTPKRRISRAI
ncbi:MAG: hypothetical protein LAO31_10310 [Acidobacteriia bacterium]|nr:hypothetical protein [Terriglobia bacterium]